MAAASTNQHLQRLAAALRRHREVHDLSLGELGRRTGLSKTSLMRLESGQANPSLETLWRIGHELDLTIAQLIEPPEPDGRELLAAGEGVRVISESGMQSRLLGHDTTKHRTEAFELTLPAGANFQAAAHDPGTAELVYCLNGTFSCGPTDDPRRLRAGDSRQYRGDQPHHYAAGPEGGQAVLIMSYPSA